MIHPIFADYNGTRHSYLLDDGRITLDMSDDYGDCIRPVDSPGEWIQASSAARAITGKNIHGWGIWHSHFGFWRLHDGFWHLQRPGHCWNKGDSIELVRRHILRCLNS